MQLNLITGSLLLIIFCILLKFLLWVRIGDYNIAGFIGSFVHFFVKHDSYDVSNKSELVFMWFNNKLNLLLYLAIVVLILGYMVAPDDVNGLIPTKREAREYKIR